MLKFATRRVANSYGGKTRYRAMLTEKSGVVDFDAVLKEVQERRRIDPVVMRYYLDMFFACVKELMLEDGCSRRIGDYLLLRLNVRGSFDSADDDIKSGRQELLISGQALDGFRHLEKGAEIANVNSRTRGKAESVMSEGGDAGTLVYGENVLLKGHGFEWDRGQMVTFNYLNEKGEKETRGIDVFLFLRDNPKMPETRVIEADDTHVLFKWPPKMPRCVVGQKVSVAYMDYNNAKVGETHGSHAYATVVASDGQA